MPSPLVNFKPMPEFSPEDIEELQAAADTDDRTPIAGELVRRIFRAIEANTSVVSRLAEDLERTQAVLEETRGNLRDSEAERLEAIRSANSAREERDRIQESLDTQVHDIHQAAQEEQANLRRALDQEVRLVHTTQGERDEARAALARARDAVRDAGRALAPVLSSAWVEGLPSAREARREAATAPEGSSVSDAQAEAIRDEDPHKVRFVDLRYLLRSPSTRTFEWRPSEDEGR